MIQEFYCTNTREYTNIPSCSMKLVFDSSLLQEGIFLSTLIKMYNKANLSFAQTEHSQYQTVIYFFIQPFKFQLLSGLIIAINHFKNLQQEEQN